MTPDALHWHINLIQERYKSLELSPAQAGQIFLHEQEKETSSEKHFFSIWEELDYDLTVFTSILNADQLKIYQEERKSTLQFHENSLMELDHENLKDIRYYEDILTFYETRLLPDLFNDPLILKFDLLFKVQPKIDFLKAEYKKFLFERKREILIDHFRHNRTYKPIELKKSILEHQLWSVWPNYLAFKYAMDEPTRHVADFMSQKIKLSGRSAELMKKKFDELKAFLDEVGKKHYPDFQGLHIALGPLLPEEEKENEIMTLVLLDREKYGYG